MEKFLDQLSWSLKSQDAVLKGNFKYAAIWWVHPAMNHQRHSWVRYVEDSVMIQTEGLSRKQSLCH